MRYVFGHEKIVCLFLLSLALLARFKDVGVEAELLPEDEVETLRTIFAKLKHKMVNVTQTSCRDGKWNQFITNKDRSNITCNCAFEKGSVCHVTNIHLKGMNLAGIIPPEFGNLTYLTEIDLTRNYISGSIPSTLSNLKLITLSALGNRITGRIPHEIGDISTLEELILEENQLSGSLPPNLGKLGNLRRMVLSANNLTGTMPDKYQNLKNLTDFRIDGNNLSGEIPKFIGNWTKLKLLHLQGTSMEGPIPSTISSLKMLTELSITDLRGAASSFPDLHDLKHLRRLILRNCLITGAIPDYVGNFNELRTLDLSSNMLSGPIPTTLESLTELRYMFLTNNSLNGTLPQFIIRKTNARAKPILGDVSYNNFTDKLPETVTCQGKDGINMFSSFQPSETNLIPWCLRKDLPCNGKAKNHGLFINCGGQSVSVEGKIYEEDSDSEKGRVIVTSDSMWAYNSIGVAFNNEDAETIAANKYELNITGPKYYQTARTSPNSLRYYGLCMHKGSYKVKLHFAEIMFSDDPTFGSLGRRVFDIFIQGKLVQKDFNIAEEAGGVGKGYTKVFDDIQVNGTSLEIHLRWTGKGTTSIPDKGVYGPLISAITITANFKVDEPLAAGAIAGIVVAGGVVVVASVLLMLKGLNYYRKKSEKENELHGLHLQTSLFTLKQIKTATNNFDEANKLGEGGFGSVYKGVLSDGTRIAVKQLSSASKQGNREFANEIGTISALRHPNLVRLYGCCCEGRELLLVYEYLENNSLARALFGPEEQRIFLNWSMRKRISLETARGLAYLHEESRLKIVHRDIKPTNVLLDAGLHAKISDFGLAKLDDDENTHISTRVAGTLGYMAPEYATRGYLTEKADVYSYGVVLLEIIAGRKNADHAHPKDFLIDWAHKLQGEDLLDLVDQGLQKKYSKEEAKTMLNLALLCTNSSPSLRPSMSSIVSVLEGKSQIALPSPLNKEKDCSEKTLWLLSQHDHAISLDSEDPFPASTSSDCSISTSHSKPNQLEKVNLSSSNRLLD